MTQPAKSNQRRALIPLLVLWLRRLIVVSAYAYPIVLAAFCLAFLFIGEDWWVTAVLLYVPRVIFGAPLVVLVPALLVLRRVRLLWTQLAALLLTLFPLMGLVLPWPVSDAGQAPSFKALSFNIESDYAGTDALMSAIDAEKPDLVLLQEAPWDGPVHEALRARFPHFEASTQFLIGSRFPILDRTDPDKIPHFGRERSPRFMRYVVDSNLGKLAVYSIHPLSPRGSVGATRMRDVLHSVRTGQILQDEVQAELKENTSLRSRQVAIASNMAGGERHPVLLAGDTNLPGLSAVLRRHLGAYDDAFRQASWGFGYTFPHRLPFLRLDRMLVSPELRFTEFKVGCLDVSDHRCVVSRVTRR